MLPITGVLHLLRWTELIVITSLIPSVESGNEASHSTMRSYLDSIEVIHGQYSAPLVLVSKKTEALRLASLFVSNQINVDNLTIPAFGRRYKHLTFTNRDQLHKSLSPVEHTCMYISMTVAIYMWV